MATRNLDNEKPQAEPELTFEQALAELERIAEAIEQGKIGLEDSIQQYERGTKLLRRCRSILTEAESRIQRLQLGEDGQLTAEPMEELPKES